MNKRSEERRRYVSLSWNIVIQRKVQCIILYGLSRGRFCQCGLQPGVNRVVWMATNAVNPGYVWIHTQVCATLLTLITRSDLHFSHRNIRSRMRVLCHMSVSKMKTKMPLLIRHVEFVPGALYTKCQGGGFNFALINRPF